MLCTDSFEYGAAHPALKATPVDTRREHRDRVIWLSRPSDVQVESLPLPCLVPKEGRTVTACCNAGRLELNSFSGFRNEIACNF
jgi:hypothetical protein